MRHGLQSSPHACARKRRHASIVGAFAELKRCSDPTVTPYRCSVCGGWHIGHAWGAAAKAAFRGERRRQAAVSAGMN